jgi:glycosyltransferase involved in cell wall biosynthesis
MSIQEAISFGIPIIATNVGGIHEIVNNRTGILIEKNFDSKKVAEQIEVFITSNKNQEEFRNGVRNFWKENFDAEKVYTEFYKILTEE